VAAAGFNSDVVCDGSVLHVQSEDRGGENPVLETLVYMGGQVLHQERSSYTDLLARGGDTAETGRRLERQHRDVVRRARHGEFAEGPHGHLDVLLADAPPLDEAIGRFLAVEPGCAPLTLTFLPATRGLAAGRLRASSGDEVVPGVPLEARLVAPGLPPACIWTGETGADGEAAVALALPSIRAGAVVFRVRTGREGRLRVEIPALLDTAAAEDLPLREDRESPEPEPVGVSAAAPLPGASPAPGSSS
jgi:hypothetical protein